MEMEKAGGFCGGNPGEAQHGDRPIDAGPCRILKKQENQ